MKRELFNISAEIDGISKIIIGLTNQLDNSKTDTLCVDSMQQAMFGVSTYLDRIAEDLCNIDMQIEDARKKEEEDRMGKVKEALIVLLSITTDSGLQEMLEDNITCEAVKACIREELKFRKEKSRDEIS